MKILPQMNVHSIRKKGIQRWACFAGILTCHVNDVPTKIRFGWKARLTAFHAL